MCPAAVAGAMTASTDGGSEFDPIEATVGEIHAAMRDGDLTAAGLVDRYLDRIDAYDDDLNAILTVNDDARDRAAALDERFDAEGPVGPLHGVPVVLKDNKDTHDMPTTAGAEALAGSVPPRDAFVVERIREAGGVILAKANLQEFAFGVDTISSLGGATRNAYDLGRRPSGSSGGTAAAIAANLGAVGTGSDTCSSVRSPPAFHSLVGLRPSRGLVSRTGIVPLCGTQDTAGPITRTVADTARLLDVMAGSDPDDPLSARGVGAVPEDGYAAHLDPDGLDGARIGVARELFGLDDPDSAPAAAAGAVTAVVDDALGDLRAAGATVVDPVAVPDREFTASARVLGFEFANHLAAYLDEIGDAAPHDSLSEIVETGTIAPSIEERIRESDVLEYEGADLESNPAYLRRLDRRGTVRNRVLAVMAEHDLDALLYPPSAVPPVEIPDNQPFAEMRCELAAHTGLPAITVPAGLTDDGLPVGLELLGRAFAEPRLIELGYAFEQAAPHRRPPEGFGPLD